MVREIFTGRGSSGNSAAKRRDPTAASCILFSALTVVFSVCMHIASFFISSGRLHENVRHEYSHFRSAGRQGRFVTPVVTSIACAHTHTTCIHAATSPHCHRVTFDVYTPVCVLLLLKKRIFTIWVPLCDEIFQPAACIFDYCLISCSLCPTCWYLLVNWTLSLEDMLK